MRNHIVRCRVSSAEMGTMKDLAISQGLSLSDLMRGAALAIRMPSKSMDNSEVRLLAQVLGQLGHIGGNLNQLVRRANAGKLDGHSPELAETLVSINRLRDRIRGMIR